MTAAVSPGIGAFLGETRQKQWIAPSIPSQWHVTEVAPAAQRPADEAARALGQMLAQQLAALAPEIQRMPADDALLQQAGQLGDFARWCTTAEGYGNALLAERCTDLAAVAVARLSANLDFPLAKILPLAGRLMRQPWASPAARVRILNQEAGARLFPADDQDDIELTWQSGIRLLAESRRRELRAARLANPRAFHIRETPVLLAHLAFFADEVPGGRSPATLVNTWSRKWHAQFADGLAPYNVSRVLALTEYRRITGEFPSPVARGQAPGPAGPETPATGLLRLVDPESVNSPADAAFMQSWLRNRDKAGPSNQPVISSRLPLAARQAYDAVRRGEFLDQDSSKEKFKGQP